MRARPDPERLAATAAVTVVAGLLLLAALFTGSQIASGQLNMADVLRRLPKPVAAVVVDDPDEARPLDCDGLDETDPDQLERYAAQHGLDLEYEPAGETPQHLAAVEWIYWRDRLVAYAEGAPAPEHRPGGSCPG